MFFSNKYIQLPQLIRLFICDEETKEEELNIGDKIEEKEIDNVIFLSNLPNEMIWSICCFLPLKSLSKFANTNKKILNLLDENSFWRIYNIKNILSSDFSDKYWCSLQKELCQKTVQWRFTSILDCIEIYNTKMTAYRRHQLDSNPIVKCDRPFTTHFSSFGVRINERGTWIGIGFVDQKIKETGEKTMGTTSELSAAYFCQDTSVIQMNRHFKKVSKITNGDIIQVILDLNTNTVMWVKNNIFIGSMQDLGSSWKNSILYPAVNLSHKSSVTLL